jgi:hypothetical protein
MAELAEAEERSEQEAVSVTVEVTVITQEAGHVLGHAAANGEITMTVKASLRINGDIMDRIPWLRDMCCDYNEKNEMMRRTRDENRLKVEDEHDNSNRLILTDVIVATFTSTSYKATSEWR